MKFYNHPTYIGYAKDAKRKKKHKKQFNAQGFDDTVTWSLDYSIVRFIYPRLKRYYELSDKIIDIDAVEGFREAIEDMLEGFKILADDEILFDKEYKKIHKAFEQLAKYHNHLWW